VNSDEAFPLPLLMHVELLLNLEVEQLGALSDPI
jgi:hypothetical protein